MADVTRGRYGPKSDVLFTIWERFNQEGIEIPFPQRVVHLKEKEAATKDQVNHPEQDAPK